MYIYKYFMLLIWRRKRKGLISKGSDVRRECFLRNDLVCASAGDLRWTLVEVQKGCTAAYLFHHNKDSTRTRSPNFRAAFKAEIIAHPTSWETAVKYSLTIAWNSHPSNKPPPGFRD